MAALTENRGAEAQIYGGRPLVTSRDSRICAQQIRDFYTTSESYRIAFSANWFLNIAFFAGFQNMSYSMERRELYAIQPPGGFMVVANRIMPAVRSFIANLTKNKPTIDALAPVTESADINSAEVTQALMEYWYRARNLQDIYEEIILWMAVCGTAFGKLQWNPSIGPQQTYQPLALQNTNIKPNGILDGSEKGLSIVPSGDKQTLFQGEVDLEPLSPFEVHTVPHTVASWRQVRGVVQASLRHVDWIADNYEKGNQVSPESNLTMGNFYQQRIRGLVSPDFADFVGGGNLSYKDHSLVLEYRELKSKNFPEGRQITIANGITLQDDVNPYAKIFPAEIELGYVPFHCVKMPGRFWSISLVEPMRPLQVEYNKVRTEIVKNRITVGRNKILAPNGSGITEDDWVNLHGLVINYNKGFEPQVMPATPLPAQTENELNYSLRDMDDVSGVHEISRGQNPTPVKSGLHANILLEADNTKIGPIIYGLERSIHMVNVGLLSMAKKFYSEQRTIRVVGQDRQIQTLDFYGSDITTDLVLVPGSAFPKSRAAEQQTLLDLWREGVFVNKQGQPDPRRLMQLMQLGGISDPTTEEDQDRKNQVWENGMFLKQMYMPPRDFDDHIVHIEEIDKFMKTPRFRFLSPKIQALYQWHKQQHTDILIQQSSSLGGYNAPPPGAPNQPSNSSQPNDPNAGGLSGMGGLQRPRDAINRGGP